MTVENPPDSNGTGSVTKLPKQPRLQEKEEPKHDIKGASIAIRQFFESSEAMPKFLWALGDTAFWRVNWWSYLDSVSTFVERSAFVKTTKTLDGFVVEDQTVFEKGKGIPA